jgi:hypothetical protein
MIKPNLQHQQNINMKNTKKTKEINQKTNLKNKTSQVSNLLNKRKIFKWKNTMDVTLQSMLFHNTNQSIQNIIKFFSNIDILTRILMITKYCNGSKHYEKEHKLWG